MPRSAALALVAAAVLVLASPAGARPLRHATWLNATTITEYFPAPERWFSGRLVSAPGLRGRHRIDWLYSARGLPMQGEGVGLDGRPYHVAAFGRGGWVNARGRRTAFRHGRWSGGPPTWYAGGVTFAPGASRPLTYYRSVAVDPRLIPLGSWIYIPAYRRVNGGWFIAQDTGGAIVGRHVDVFRPAPATPEGGNYLKNQSIYVVPPKAHA